MLAHYPSDRVAVERAEKGKVGESCVTANYARSY